MVVNGANITAKKVLSGGVAMGFAATKKGDHTSVRAIDSPV
jgi:hypothetical protein